MAAPVLAARSMLAVAREEVAVLTAEVASTARTAVLEAQPALGGGAVQAARHEAMNPLVVREMVAGAAKEGLAAGRMGGETMIGSVRSAAELVPKEGESILSTHLSILAESAPIPSKLPLPPSGVNVLAESALGSTSSIGARAGASVGGAGRSVIADALAADSQAAFREVLSNTAQTGVEEQMDTVTQVAKVLAEEMASAVGSGGAAESGSVAGAAGMREVGEVVAELRAGAAKAVEEVKVAA